MSPDWGRGVVRRDHKELANRYCKGQRRFFCLCLGVESDLDLRVGPGRFEDNVSTVRIDNLDVAALRVRHLRHRTLSMVHLGRSTCHAISCRGN